MFVFTDSVKKLLLADGGQGLEVLQRLLERLLGGVVLGSLDAEVHLVLEGVRHAVAREHHAGVHQQHVAQRVPERVVLLRAMLTIQAEGTITISSCVYLINWIRTGCIN